MYCKCNESLTHFMVSIYTVLHSHESVCYSHGVIELIFFVLFHRTTVSGNCFLSSNLTLRHDVDAMGTCADMTGG